MKTRIFHHRYFITRFYVVVSILLSVMAILFEPATLHAHATSAAQLPDLLFYCAIGVCAVAFTDIFFNDILPNKYQFKLAYNYRHIVYMCLALISFSLSAGLLVAFGGSILVGRLWLDGSIASLVAVLDIFARHRGKL